MDISNLSDTEYKLLCRVRDNDPELDFELPPDERSLLNAFHSSKLVKVSINGKYYLSDKGNQALIRYAALLEKEAKEHAEHKVDNEAAERSTENRWRKDARRSWIQFWLNALFGLISFFVGVVLEHFFSIIDLLMKIL